MKDSQLREVETRSCVLADRVKLLEAEVTKLLSDQHLHSPSQANPTPSQSDSAPTPSNPPSNSSQCSSCSQLTSEMQGFRAQLADLTNILHLHLADTEGCTLPTSLPQGIDKFTNHNTLPMPMA